MSEACLDLTGTSQNQKAIQSGIYLVQVGSTILLETMALSIWRFLKIKSQALNFFIVVIGLFVRSVYGVAFLCMSWLVLC